MMMRSPRIQKITHTQMRKPDAKSSANSLRPCVPWQSRRPTRNEPDARHQPRRRWISSQLMRIRLLHWGPRPQHLRKKEKMNTNVKMTDIHIGDGGQKNAHAHTHTQGRTHGRTGTTFCCTRCCVGVQDICIAWLLHVSECVCERVCVDV